MRTHVNSVDMYGLMNQREVEEYIAPKFRYEGGWSRIFDEDVPAKIFEMEGPMFNRDRRYFSIAPRHLNVILFEALILAADTGDAKVTTEHIEQIY